MKKARVEGGTSIYFQQIDKALYETPGEHDCYRDRHVLKWSSDPVILAMRLTKAAEWLIRHALSDREMIIEVDEEDGE